MTQVTRQPVVREQEGNYTGEKLVFKSGGRFFFLIIMKKKHVTIHKEKIIANCAFGLINLMEENI